MFKTIITISVLFILCTIGYFCIPKYNIEVCRRKQVILEKDFVSIRKALSQGKFEEQILQANNAIMIQKSWTDKNFQIQRLIGKDKYWEFSGTLYAQVQVESQGKPMVVELQHDVLVSTTKIELEATLIRPLEIGVTDLRQKIFMKPIGHKTLVQIEVAMKLHRFVPFFMHEYAKQALMKAADNSANIIESAIKDLPQ